MANKGTKYKKISQAQKLEIADYYINGWTDEEGNLQSPTIAELSKKYEMSEHTLYKMAKQGAWKVKQQDQITRYQQEISKKKREKLSLEGVAIDDRIINVSKQLLDKVVNNINKKENLYSGVRLFIIMQQNCNEHAKLIGFIFLLLQQSPSLS